MKKNICKVKDLLPKYGHLYHFNYSWTGEKFYMPIDEALEMIGYELSNMDIRYIGDYNDIKGYFDCNVCEIEDENMSDTELSKHFNKLFKSGCVTELIELVTEEGLKFVKKTNTSIEYCVEKNEDDSILCFNSKTGAEEAFANVTDFLKRVKVIN